MLDWSQPPQRVYDHIRSISPQPSRARRSARAVKILAARVVTPGELAREIGAGVVPEHAGELRVVRGVRHFACAGIAPDGASAVVVDRLIAPNRGPMSGGSSHAWQRGAHGERA